jgi:hypothetical protein
MNRFSGVRVRPLGTRELKHKSTLFSPDQRMSSPVREGFISAFGEIIGNL